MERVVREIDLSMKGADMNLHESNGVLVSDSKKIYMTWWLSLKNYKQGKEFKINPL